MIQAKVSVIIPVYNAEKYLEQCVNSVRSQTLRDIEIICVDDGSTDRSLEILHRLAAEDDRIQVLQQKNQYAGVARNNGMTAATGEYYMFLDADDFFEPELLELLYEKGRQLEADVVLCDFDRYDERSGKFEYMSWSLSKRHIKEQPFNSSTYPEDIFQVISLEPWNKMVSARFAAKHGLRFQALPRANDVFFTMMSMALAERIAAVDKVLVHYRVGMSTNLQARNHLSPTAFCEALEAVQRRLEAEGLFDSLWRSFAENALSQMVYSLRKLSASPAAYRTLAAWIRNKYLEQFAVLRGMNEHCLNESAAKELISLMENQPLQPLELTSLPTDESGERPCVSVIIPVYNVKKYLAECLDSIVGQTLRNIEILCVDDGSTDGSAEILEAYAQKDPRIRILPQSNSGVSVARNTGLLAARGEYLYCLDSDDVLAAEALETAYQVSRANRLDILYFDFLRFYDDGSEGKPVERRNLSDVRDGVSFCRTLKDRREYLGVVWTQLYSRSFLEANHLRFYPGIIHEDELFVFTALMKAQRVSHIPRVFYRHRVRENSIMTAGKGHKNVTGYFVGMKEILLYGLQEKHDPEKAAEIYRAFKGAQEKVREHYELVPNEEKAEMEFGDAFSLLLFEKLVLEMGEAAPDDSFGSVSPYGAQKERVLSMINRQLTQEIEDMRSSASYRLGRLITWLPRKFQGLLRCYRDHGIGYTLERFLVHLHLRADDSKVDSVPKPASKEE